MNKYAIIIALLFCRAAFAGALPDGCVQTTPDIVSCADGSQQSIFDVGSAPLGIRSDYHGTRDVPIASPPAQGDIRIILNGASDGAVCADINVVREDGKPLFSASLNQNGGPCKAAKQKTPEITIHFNTGE